MGIRVLIWKLEWAGHEGELDELETCLGRLGTGCALLEPEPNGIQVNTKETHQK